MAIGENIRKIRELKGLKQETVAERLKMSQANYSKLENSDADIPQARLEEIAKALDVEVEDILRFDQRIFFNQTNSPFSNSCNFNSPININDIKVFEEIIESKNKLISALEKQILMMEALMKDKGNGDEARDDDGGYGDFSEGHGEEGGSDGG